MFAFNIGTPHITTYLHMSEKQINSRGIQYLWLKMKMIVKNKTKITQQCKGKNESNVTFHILTFEMFFFFISQYCNCSFNKITKLWDSHICVRIVRRQQWGIMTFILCWCTWNVWFWSPPQVYFLRGWARRWTCLDLNPDDSLEPAHREGKC